METNKISQCHSVRPLTVTNQNVNTNVVKLLKETLADYATEHGPNIRGLVDSDVAQGIRQDLADTTEGSDNNLPAGALFELGGVYFYEGKEIPARNATGEILCVLECVEHKAAAAGPEKSGPRKPSS